MSKATLQDLVETAVQSGNQEYLSYVFDKACTENCVSSVEKLISAGVDVHANTDLGFRLAVTSASVDVARYLLEVYVFDIHGNHEIMLRNAAEGGDFEVVRLLVEHGADVRDVDPRDVKLLMNSQGVTRKIAEHTFTAENLAYQNGFEGLATYIRGFHAIADLQDRMRSLLEMCDSLDEMTAQDLLTGTFETMLVGNIECPIPNYVAAILFADTDRAIDIIAKNVSDLDALSFSNIPYRDVLISLDCLQEVKDIHQKIKREKLREYTRKNRSNVILKRRPPR